MCNAISSFSAGTSTKLCFGRKLLLLTSLKISWPVTAMDARNKPPQSEKSTWLRIL